MDHRRAVDEERITMLETMLRETSEAATECERKYEEVYTNRQVLSIYSTLTCSDSLHAYICRRNKLYYVVSTVHVHSCCKVLIQCFSTVG